MRLPFHADVRGPVGGRKELALCGGSAWSRRWMIRVDQVIRCVCWPGMRRRAAKAEPALTPGRSGAALINLLIRGTGQVAVYLRRRRACMRIAPAFAANGAGSVTSLWLLSRGRDHVTAGGRRASPLIRRQASRPGPQGAAATEDRKRRGSMNDGERGPFDP